MTSLEAALARLRAGLGDSGVGRDDVRLRGAMAARHQAHRRGRSPADSAGRSAARADRAGDAHVSRADGPGARVDGLAGARLERWPASMSCPPRSTDTCTVKSGARGTGSIACRGRTSASARTSPARHRDLAAHARHRAGRVPRAGARRRRQRRNRLLRAAARVHRPPRRTPVPRRDRCDRAWDGGTTRVWLHTCTLDHPRALTNYLAGGLSRGPRGSLHGSSRDGRRALTPPAAPSPS